jgi:hypothetical protein
MTKKGKERRSTAEFLEQKTRWPKKKKIKPLPHKPKIMITKPKKAEKNRKESKLLARFLPKCQFVLCFKERGVLGNTKKTIPSK